MAQVYSFIDGNGETRLLAEISPPPASAFNGGTITDPLKITSDAQGLLVRTADDAHTLLTAGPVSGFFACASVDNTGNSTLGVTTTSLTFKDELGNIPLDIEGGYVSLGASGAVFITPNNYLTVSNHAAPADGEISAGDCALWFDQTDGAGKLMIKAKTANGTVATGSVSLT